MPTLLGRLLVVGLAAALMVVEIDATPAARVAPVMDAPVTFSKDVAPIVFDHCGICHHPNGSARSACSPIQRRGSARPRLPR